MGETRSSFTVQNLHAPQMLRRCQRAPCPPCSFQSLPQRASPFLTGGRKGAAKFLQWSACRELRGKSTAPSSLLSPWYTYQLWLLWHIARRGVLLLPPSRKICRRQSFKYPKLTHPAQLERVRQSSCEQPLGQACRDQPGGRQTLGRIASPHPTPLPIYVDGPRKAKAPQRAAMQLRGQHRQCHLTGADLLSAGGCTRMVTESRCATTPMSPRRP